MTKMTKKVALSYALALLNETELPDVSKEEVTAKLTDMLASLDKKSSTDEKKMTEHQQENETFKGYIVTHLGNGEPKTATEILKEIAVFPSSMTIQRVTAMLRQLVLDGYVTKEMVKGKAKFSIVEQKEGAEGDE